MAAGLMHSTLGLFTFMILHASTKAVKYTLLDDIAVVGPDANSVITEYPGILSPRHCAQLCTAHSLCVSGNYDRNIYTCQLMSGVVPDTEDRPGNIAVGKFILV